MGQKQLKNFYFPAKCIGQNIPNFSNKLPLKLKTSDENNALNVDLFFKQIPAYQNQSPLSSLVFVTYNIWFQLHNETNRIPAIFKLLQISNADFICLQEVTRSFVQQLRKQQWVKSYNVSGYQMHSYDTLILSKYGCQFKHYKYQTSSMGRSLVVAETLLNGKVFGVATSHFESLSHTDIRIKQLTKAFQKLDHYEDAILMGDFNYDSKYGKQQQIIPKKWKDLYLQVHQSTDMTMPKTNRYDAWRPDRILLKSNNYSIQHIERIGNFTIPPCEHQQLQKIENDGIVRTPSDHFGIVGKIRFIK